MRDEHRNRKIFGFLLTATVVLATAGGAGAKQPISQGKALLARSIAYHDPGGVWAEGSFVLELAATRPDGPDRQSRATIDNARGRFLLSERRTGVQIERALGDGECTFRVDGSQSYGDEQAEALGLSCERLIRMRNYYTYLWGLPMKLRDPGTRLSPRVENDTFDGREALALRVTYDESVGQDIWYFYFDPETAALIGYRFYHDEAANDGEYITLEGETTLLDGDRVLLRLPRERTWYTHQEDKLLGTDTLTVLEQAAE